jgi:chromate transporter
VHYGGHLQIVSSARPDHAGPLAAQVAIAIGYFEGGVLGAMLSGLAFVLPSFLMVVGISLAYVAYTGLWWLQALCYAIGATVIAIILIAAYKLARSTNKRDPLLWGVFVWPLSASRGARQ